MDKIRIDITRPDIAKSVAHMKHTKLAPLLWTEMRERKPEYSQNCIATQFTIRYTAKALTSDRDQVCRRMENL